MSGELEVESARTEISEMLPLPSEPIPTTETIISFKLRCSHLPDVLHKTVEVLGALLNLNSESVGMTTLKALYAHPLQILKTCSSVVWESIPSNRQLRIVKLLTKQYDMPNAGRYKGFIQQETMIFLKLPYFTRIVKTIESLISITCPRVWKDITSKCYKCTCSQLTELESIPRLLETEHENAHYNLVFEKRKLDQTVSNLRDAISTLKGCNGIDSEFDFSMVAVAVKTSEPPLLLELLCVSVFLALSPGMNATDDDVPDWPMVANSVFSADGISFSQKLYDITNLVWNEKKSTLLLRLAKRLTERFARTASTEILTSLYRWVVAACDYLSQINSMKPLQILIKSYDCNVSVWSDHLQRCKNSILEYKNRNIETDEENYIADTKNKIIPKRQSNCDLTICEARSKLVSTIQGWSNYDPTSDHLTPSYIKKLFDAYDIDKSGYLSISELEIMYCSLEQFGIPITSNTISGILKQNNQNDDKINCDVFTVMMLGLAAR